MVEFDNQFQELGAILGIAAFAGLLAGWLRQPLIVAFIAVGVAVGPAWLDIVSGEEELELLAEVGIALLLFVVGLKLDLGVVRESGRVALVSGVGQVIFTCALGFVVALALGFGATASFYIAIALTFSSTIIIVKLLSDKREIDSLHGRIAVGILIVQDIVVVLTIIGLSAFGAEGTENPGREALFIVLKGLGLLAAVGLLMRFVIPLVLPVLARSAELLILASISWAVALAAIGDGLGFSKEVGAFLAGISLASTPYRESISGRLVPVRDFLLLFFFVNLGAGLDLDGVRDQLPRATLLSMFVLVGNPIVVIVMMGMMGYRKRTGFLAGLAIAQISEFSLILAALGVSLGHIDDETLGVITLVGLITIGLSTYLIVYSHALYERFARFLTPFERDVEHPEDRGDPEAPPACDLILFGLGRYGGDMARSLRERGRGVLGVDFDPQAVRRMRESGFAVYYGDAEDPEFLRVLPLQGAEWVVCSAPGRETNVSLYRALRAESFAGKIALTAHNEVDAEYFTRMGVDLVLKPFADAAVRAVEELTQAG